MTISGGCERIRRKCEVRLIGERWVVKKAMWRYRVCGDRKGIDG